MDELGGERVTLRRTHEFILHGDALRTADDNPLRRGLRPFISSMSEGVSTRASRFTYTRIGLHIYLLCIFR